MGRLGLGGDKPLRKIGELSGGEVSYLHLYIPLRIFIRELKLLVLCQ